MASVLENQLLPQLEQRRERLQTMIAAIPGEAQFVRLLSEVDAALERAAAGTFGLCETCHDPVEPERLLANPLLRCGLAPAVELLAACSAGLASHFAGARPTDGLTPTALRRSG